MSLCVAWRWQGKFCLASESCITIGAEQRMCGVKVVQVPVRVISVVEASTQKFDVVFQSVFGLTFAGTFLPAYLIRETASEVLYNLQYLRGKETLYFENICEIVFNIYRHIVDTLGNDLDILFVGTCPASNKSKAALFFRDTADEKLKWKTILDKYPFDYLAIGSGENYFHEKLEQNRKSEGRIHFAILQSLQEIAESRPIPSVGGAVQYGETDDGGQFHLTGTLDFVKRNGQIEKVESIRGIELNKIHTSKGFDDLHVNYPFIHPFEKKVKRLLSE